VQQLPGGRVSGGQPIRGEGDGGGQRQRVTGGRAALAHQLGRVAGEILQVCVDRQARLREQVHGLAHGQWQVAEVAGEPVGGVLVEVGQAGPQKRDGLGPAEHVHVHRLCDTCPVRVAAGDQQVAGAVRQPWCEVITILGIVEDQQPSSGPAQVCTQRLHRVGCGRPGRGQAQLVVLGQGGQMVTDQFRLLGGDPPDDVVLAGESVGVLQSELGLSDAAHPVQCLNRHPAAAAERVVEPVEHGVAAGEARVAAGQVPHRRQRTRRPRPRIPCGLTAGIGRGHRRERPGRARVDDSPYRVEQQGDRPIRRQAEDVRYDDRRPQAVVQVDVLHPQRDQCRGRVPAALRHPGGPLVGGEPLRVQVGRRQQHQQRIVAPQRPVHRLDGVGARRPVDAVQLDGVPGLLEMPARPLRPRAVPVGERDDDAVGHAVHIAANRPGKRPPNGRPHRRATGRT
jgi:hypothetical protein